MTRSSERLSLIVVESSVMASSFVPGRRLHDHRATSASGSDHDIRHALAELGQIEQWVTWTADPSPYHYQWALVRTPTVPRFEQP